MSDLKRYNGIHVFNGMVRRLTFEAATPEEAQQLAAKWEVGVEGEAPEAGAVKSALPEAYDLKTTRQLLGGVSERTVWRWLICGDLQRIPGVRRVLVTRRSIERFSAGRG